MEVSWSRFRGFEGRSDFIIMSMEAIEFIKIVEKIKENTASEFHIEFIKKRVDPFNKIFSIFMPIFPEISKKSYLKALNLARNEKYTEIENKTLLSMENFLERFSTNLSLEQSEDMELLSAMR